jgi:hypothetical protein
VLSEDQNGPGNLVCFESRSTESESLHPQKFTAKTVSATRAIAVDILKSSASVNATAESYDVLLVHEDCAVECFSSDLSSSLWATNVNSQSPTLSSQQGSSTIQLAVLSNASAVGGSLLAAREDVVAQINGIAAKMGLDPTRLPILCSIHSRPDSSNLYLVLTVIKPQQNVAFGGETGTQHLITWTLPVHPSSDEESQSLNYSLNLNSGLVHVASSSTISTYSFSQSSPSISSEINIVSRVSQIPLSGSTLLAASPTGYSVYDVQYNSVLDRRSYGSSVAGKKRKRSADTPGYHSALLVEYYPKSALAIALQSSELVAIRMVTSSKTELIDVVGKAVRTKSQPPPLTNGTVPNGHSEDLSGSIVARAKWEAAQDKLEEFAALNDIAQFERLFASMIGIDPAKDGLIEDHAFLPGGENEDDVIDIPLWRLPDYKSPPTVEVFREQAIFALSLIFKWDSDHSGNETSPTPALRIEFYPINVFRWLVMTGQLTTNFIKQALYQYHSDLEGIGSLSKLDLVNAIVQFDPSLGVLCHVLSHHIHLEAEDLIQATKAIIQSLDDSTLPAPKTLLNDGDENLPNGDPNHDILDETDEVMDELDYAIATLETGEDMRGAALQLVVSQLNSLPMHKITEGFRAALTQHEIVFLVHLLRMELAVGGWTSYYVQGEIPAADGIVNGGSSDRGIVVIARLLSCAVDAIGLDGWLSSSANAPADSVNELLVSLRAEISAALEGINEATFMSGLLGEFLHYVAALADEVRASKKNPIKTKVRPANELPMGLKVKEWESSTKLDSSGQVRVKSKREIGMEIRMKVPKYSFERIRVR